MLKSMPNFDSRQFSLEDISPDGMKGCLIPKMEICKTHQPIAVTEYEDGVLRIGMIQIDTKKIVSGLNSCVITATAFGDGIVMVRMYMFGARDSASVRFEYKDNQSRQKSLYRIDEGDRTEHSFISELKPFSKLSLGQKIAKVLSLGLASPCVTE